MLEVTLGDDPGKDRKELAMKALVYHGPGRRGLRSRYPIRHVEVPTDVVVRIDSATICGTDLHILKGDVPEVMPGTILGHEAVGTVVETGDGVSTLDLPTAYEVGVLNGGVQPGDLVAIVGAGPIGLAAIMTAKLYTPGTIVAIDLVDARLDQALAFGADVVVNNGLEDAVARVQELTGGLGADVAIEAVGVPATFELCADLVRPGGRVANVGVHGHSATLHLEKLWIRDVTITTGLVDTTTTHQLMRLIAEGRLDPRPFATHRFPLAGNRSGERPLRHARRDERAQGRARGRTGRSGAAGACRGQSSPEGPKFGNEGRSRRPSLHLAQGVSGSNRMATRKGPGQTGPFLRALRPRVAGARAI